MLEAIMRTNIVMLAVLAGLGLSSGGAVAADNLSCISETSPNEQRLLRDCEPKPEEEIYYVLEVLDLPPPPPPPFPIKNGEGGKGGGAHGHDQDHDAPDGGGDPGPSF
jgi:hypothetical protein